MAAIMKLAAEGGGEIVAYVRRLFMKRIYLYRNRKARVHSGVARQ